MAFWTCTPDWTGQTAFVICGGSSLRGVDLSPLEHRKTIAVNSSIFAAPFVDYLLFGDRRWWVHNSTSLPKMRGKIVTNSPTVNQPQLLTMRKVKPPPGITDERDALVTSYTTTQGALNLAVHLGCTRIVLLGADARVGKDGRQHHHPEHPWIGHANQFELQIAALEHAVRPLRKRGVEVINTSLQSAIPFWPKVSLETCLEQFA